MQTVFVDEFLAGILAGFSEKAGVRIDALMERDAAAGSMPEAGSLPAVPVQESLVEGACADLAREVRHARDMVVAARRGLPPEAVAEFAYLLAALADEILISAFQERLPHRFSGAVEHALFGTKDAGEQIFARIDRLVARRGDLDAGLACAYLLALSVGFKGQYSTQGAEMIAHYHRELSAIALLTPREPSRPRVAPAAPPLRPVRRYAASLCAAAVVVWLVAVIGMEDAWRKAVGPLRGALAGLEEEAGPVRPAGDGGAR